MQFGLCNAASTFQRFADEVLRGLNFVYAFIDDILVASSSEAEYIQHLRLLFQQLDQYGLSINPSKCTFGASGIKKRPKRNVKIKPEEALQWTDEATTAFELVKQVLAHATLLHHPMPNAPLSIWVDASDFAVGGAFEQYHENVWQPLAFLSMNCLHPKRTALHTTENS
ncbi:transposon Tf2-6 polyprotein [Trichonephila clavipes]|nr:transposon Tf2-6 polyprotein [Trichonephila clavipes]